MTEATPLARYAVIGNPIAHSRSPQIHALFSQQTGKPLRYERLLAPVDGFAEATAAFDRYDAARALELTEAFF